MSASVSFPVADVSEPSVPRVEPVPVLLSEDGSMRTDASSAQAVSERIAAQSARRGMSVASPSFMLDKSLVADDWIAQSDVTAPRGPIGVHPSLRPRAPGGEARLHTLHLSRP